MRQDSTFSKIGDLLSDETSLRILGILSMGPQFVKNIARLTDKPESRISEKVSSLRKLGMIDYQWARVNGRNVKKYSLTTKKIEISFSGGQPRLGIKKKESYVKIQAPDFFEFSPPKLKIFIGRKKELKEIEERSKIFITGISGIGKTSLVARYVTDVKEPIFWHAMREVDSFDYLIMKISSFLRNIGRMNLGNMIEIGASKRMIIDYCISELRKSKSVIVIDDFQLCRDKSMIEFIGDLTFSVPSLKIILISKETTPPFNGFHVISLSGLSTEESKLFLLKTGKIHDAKTISSIGGYPLALSLMGKISEENVTIDTLTHTLAKIIKEELSNSEREILLWASAFRESFTQEELDFVLKRESWRELENLVSKGLILPRYRSYFVHEFVRKIAGSLMDDPELIHETLGHYYASKSDPTSSIEAIYHFGVARNSDYLVKLIREKASSLIYSGFSEPLVSVLNALRTKYHDPVVKSWILLKIAIVEKMSGNFSVAKEMFADIIESSKNMDVELTVRATMGLGQTLDFLGKKIEAVETLQKALFAEREMLNMKDLEATILTSLGVTLTNIGKLNEGEPAISEAIDIYREIKDWRNYYTAVYYRGFLRYLRGELKEEIRDMDEAYSGYFELNFLVDAATCLVPKALALWKQGNINKAILVINKGIEIYRDQREKMIEGELTLALCCRALIYASGGKLVKADKDLREAESYGRGKEDYLSNTAWGIARGVIEAFKGNWDSSDHYLTLAENAASNHPYYLCEAKRWRGWSLIKRGLVDKGREELEEVRDIAYKNGLLIFADDIEKLLIQIESPAVMRIRY